jgi:uncharacterized sulfatase
MEGHFAAAGFSAGMVELAGPPGMKSASRLIRESLDPVLDFVNDNADRPFFLWFAPRLPHLPHDPPARFLELYRDTDVPSALRPYYASISWFDEAVGLLLDHLDAGGLREQTLVVYLADNGWDPSPPEVPKNFSIGGPRGKKSLYELGFRTPIVLHHPGTLSPARLEEALVSIADLFPTLLEYAGARVPAGRLGRSLRPLLEGSSDWPRTELVGWTHVIRNSPSKRITGGFFWRDARWHYLQPYLLPVELYDLGADPLESRNVAGENPEVVRQATLAIRSWSRSLPSVETRQP